MYCIYGHKRLSRENTRPLPPPSTDRLIAKEEDYLSNGISLLPNSLYRSVIVYNRVSSPKQEESLPRITGSALKVIEEYNVRVSNVFTGVECATSGDNRPVLKEALRECHKRNLPLCAPTLDRLIRSANFRLKDHRDDLPTRSELKEFRKRYGLTRMYVLFPIDSTNDEMDKYLETLGKEYEKTNDHEIIKNAIIRQREDMHVEDIPKYLYLRYGFKRSKRWIQSVYSSKTRLRTHNL